MFDAMKLNAARRGPQLGILLEHLVAFAMITGLAILLRGGLSLSGLFVWKVIAALSAGGAVTSTLAIKYLRTPALGAANRVTLVRGGLATLLLGFFGEAELGWAAVAIATTILLLDGVDGWLARRLEVSSDFGARFDMETDALFLVAVTGLVWLYGKAGAWVLLAGLMRYAFVVAARALPQIAGPLPPNWRRQAAFVSAAAAMVACLAPVVTQPLSTVLALVGLLTLTLSFAIDVTHLARANRECASAITR